MKPRMLVIGKTPAMHDRSGSDRRLFEILRTLAPEIEIDFLATNHVMHNLQERINKTDVYYAVRDGNFNVDRFRFVESQYFDDLRAIGVRPLNEPRPRALTLRPTNDYDIREFLGARTYDLVWIETFYVADSYLAQIRRFQPWAKVYVDSVDLHYLRLERQAQYLEREVKYVINVKQERQPIGEDHAQKIADHYCYARQVEKDEMRVYSQADGIIAASADDEAHLLARFPREKVILIPNIYEIPSASPAGPEKRRGLLFVGNFDHNPNVSAAIFLKHEICPLVSAPLQIVGNNPLYLIKTMQRHGPAAKRIKVTGHVPSLAPYLSRARVSLAPVLFDSGMTSKIGESMAAGLPVVTTSLGARCSGLVAGEHCLVADSAEDFAAAVQTLCADDALWRKLQAGGLALVREQFSREAVAPLVRERLRASFDLPKIRGHQGLVRARVRKPFALPAPRFAKVKDPEITVILVTYNQWQVTELCLRSLAHAQRAFPGVRTEILLVDNASADGTADRAARIPNLRVIRNKKNLGFARGNNVGIRAARGRDVVLLNNDTVVAPNWLAQLAHHARTIPDAGVIGPSTNTETAQVIPFFRYNSVEEFFAANEELRVKNGGAWETVGKISGLCMYLPRRTLDAVGLLDEGFGIGYFEDDDYCMRIRDAGLKLVCAKDVYVHHFGNMSFEGNSMNRLKILEAGMNRFVFKWGKRAMDYLEANHQNTSMQFTSVKEKTGF